MKTMKILLGTLGLILATSFSSFAQDSGEQRTELSSEQEHNQEITNAINTWWNTPRDRRGVNGAWSTLINLRPDPGAPEPDKFYKTVFIGPCDRKGFRWVTVRIFHEFTQGGWRRKSWRTWSWKVPCPRDQTE